MRTALGGKMEIPGQQFQIAHAEIAFEHETLLIACVVKMRVIDGTGQSSN